MVVVTAFGLDWRRIGSKCAHRFRGVSAGLIDSMLMCFLNLYMVVLT